MKLKIMLGCAVGIATVLASCSDQMNYAEYNNYGEEYTKQNFDNIKGMVTNVYSQMDYDYGTYGAAMEASACDEAEYAVAGSTVESFFNGGWSPSAPLKTWDADYKAISDINHYLDKFAYGLTFSELELNQDYQKQMYRYHHYPFEMRWLRAYFYFRLVKTFGDVPFYTTDISKDEVNSLTRTPAADILKFIWDECTEITDSLPTNWENDGNMPETEPGRVNRLGILALKGRAALYAASPLFNSNNDKELWHKAALANKAVLDSCLADGYKLVDDYSTLWGESNYQTGNGKEVIFARRVGGLRNLESRNFPAGVDGGNGGNCPTQNLADAYEMKATGKLWNEAGSGYDENNPFEGRDPRFRLTFACNGDKQWPTYNTTALETFQGGQNGQGGPATTGATPTGYYLKKLLNASVDLRSGKQNTKLHSWITFRLGEFYLNYAEAVFKYLGSADATSSEFPMSAREAVNKIRSRKGVSMPALPQGLSNDEFWTRYKRERQVELAFEGHRFYDIRRWKEADQYKDIVELKITKNADGTLSYRRETVTRPWDDKMYFFPISQTERAKNPNLTQNPGW